MAEEVEINNLKLGFYHNNPSVICLNSGSNNKDESKAYLRR